jgi:glucose-1-phosphate adenylyltransferase
MDDPLLVILAGGVSSRMKRPGSASLDPRTLRDAQDKPKSMIAVDGAGRPFLDYLLYHAECAGYRDVVLVTGQEGSAFRSHYGSADTGNRFHRLEISYAIQPVREGRTKPLGTADALLCALRVKTGWRHRAFTMCNSDNLYSMNSLRTMLASGRGGAIIAFDRKSLGQSSSRAQHFAVVRTSPDGFLEEIVEKPSEEDMRRIASGQGTVGVSMNIFRFDYDVILPFLESVPLHPVRQELELPTAVMLMVRRFPKSMRVFPAMEEVPDLTHRDDISRVRAYIARTYPRFTWS